MTQEDKMWIGGGVALAVGGGIYWYTQHKKSTDATTTDTTTDTPALSDTPTPKATHPRLSTPPLVDTTNDTAVMPAVTTPTKSPDEFSYSIGQEVMAVGSAGTKGYGVRKMADGNYIPDSTKLTTTFQKGDKIGTIIWIGKKPDGTFRYVVERNGNFVNLIYWIASKDVIAPCGVKLPIKPVVTATTGVDKNKLLKIGSKGIEVKRLQTLLKLKVDGDFGINTQKALKNQKGVTQIRLKDWK